MIAQIVPRKINKFQALKDPLLVVVYANSLHDVAHFWNERLIKFRPLNKGGKWRHVRELMSHRDLLYNKGCIEWWRQVNVYNVLIKLALRGSIGGGFNG